jgi:HD-GYP domain-containing protein (c-di-GMP phosphodiesterase class II)
VLTTDRPYRHACAGTEARRVIREEAGNHLDRRVVAALMRALDGNLLHSVSDRKAGPAPWKIAAQKEASLQVPR